MTLADVRAANKAAGFNWFDRATMRFWACRIHGGLRKGRYFITSEDNFDRSKRLFSIREAMPDGSIHTPRFQRFATLAEAREGLKEVDA